jgi:hypothetical protein
MEREMLGKIFEQEDKVCRGDGKKELPVRSKRTQNVGRIGASNDPLAHSAALVLHKRA